MAVFAWILFILSALFALVSVWEWFGEGRALLTLFQTLGITAYCIFYLFIFPLGLVANWIFFGVYCAFALVALCTRNVYGTLHGTTSAIFLALVLFL
ncbi:MAG: hypothetical protein IJ996_02380 [Clostridia bacterium]|nr:hypothetical protein [Clostridia bacterium]